MLRDDLGFRGDRVADVNGRREFPVLAQEHRTRSGHVHGDQRVDQARRQPTLHDKTAEFRPGGERLVEMQRIVIA